MTGLYGANLLQQSQKPQLPNQQPARNIFASGLNQHQHARRHERHEEVNIFSSFLGPCRDENVVWRIDAPPPLIVEESRQEFLTSIKPQIKEDRSLAVGLNKGFKKTHAPGNNPGQQSFLDLHSTNRFQNGGPCPHFLAEA